MTKSDCEGYYNVDTTQAGGIHAAKSECSETESARPQAPSSPSSEDTAASSASHKEPQRPSRACDEGVDSHTRMATSLPSYCNLPSAKVVGKMAPPPPPPPPMLPRRQPHMRRHCTSPSHRRSQPLPPPPPPPPANQPPLKLEPVPSERPKSALARSSESTSVAAGAEDANSDEVFYQNQSTMTVQRSQFRRKVPAQSSNGTGGSGSHRSMRRRTNVSGGGGCATSSVKSQRPVSAAASISNSVGGGGCQCKAGDGRVQQQPMQIRGKHS